MAGTRTPLAAGPGAPTIDVSDGREFWEAWVDSRDAGATPAPPSSGGETEGARKPRSTPAGQVRLYLNLGKRDQMTRESVAALLAPTGIEPTHLDVQLSHTYVTVAEANAPALCAAIAGQRHGERTIVCEPAKK